MKRFLVPGLVAALLLTSSVAIAVEAPAPSDVKGHWAEKDILDLVARGVISGYPDGTFRPDAAVTRGAFLKMLVTAAGLPPARTLPSPYADTSTHWCYADGYLEAALREAIVLVSDPVLNTLNNMGDPNAPPVYLFWPDTAITRYQMVTLVIRAMGLASAAALAKGSGPFADARDHGSVNLAASLNLVGGSADGLFHPDDGATRAEAAVLISRLLAAQASPPPPVRGTFVRTFGNAQSAAFSVRQLADSGYVIAGRKQDWGAVSGDALLLRTDAAGRVLWHRTYGGARTEAFYDVRVLPDASLVAAGTLGSGEMGSDDGWLVRTDASGEKTWELIVFGGPSRDESRALVEAPDGLLVAGTTELDLYSTAGQPAVAKVSPDGKKLWETRFPGQARAWDVVAGPAGSCVVAGTMRDSTYRDHGWAAMVDAQGGVVWSRTYAASAAASDEVRAVLATGDGFVLAGDTGFDGAARLLLIDQQGGPIRDTRLEAEEPIRRLYDAALTPDGGYVLAGESWSGKVWLAKADAQGGPVWSKTFDRGQSDFATAVAATADAGFALVSAPPYPYGPGGALFIKTDAEGRLFIYP